MVECKNCGRERPEFCLGPKDCDICRTETKRANATKPKLSAGDVMGKARKILQGTDWTQLPDIAPEKSVKWSAYRASIRKIVKNMKAGKAPSRVRWPKPPT